MTTYDQDRSSGGERAERSEAGGAPGKRTLTQGIPPRAGLTEAMQERFDGSSEYMEARLTIDGPPRLAPHQLRRARRKNPGWLRRLGFDPLRWSSAAIGSDEFATDVAAKQARDGLRADGIVGPETAAIHGAVAAPSADDPFALHLLEPSESL